MIYSESDIEKACQNFNIHLLDGIHYLNVNKLRNIERRIPRLPNLSKRVDYILNQRMSNPNSRRLVPKSLNVDWFSSLPVTTPVYLCLTKTINLILYDYSHHKSLASKPRYQKTVALIKSETEVPIQARSTLLSYFKSIYDYFMSKNHPQPISIMSDICNTLYCGAAPNDIIHYPCAVLSPSTMNFDYFVIHLHYLLAEIKCQQNKINQKWVNQELRMIRGLFPSFYKHFNRNIQTRIWSTYHQYRF